MLYPNHRISTFKHDGQTWQQSTDDTTADTLPTGRLSLYTANIWFGEWQQKARAHATFGEISSLLPDFVCLQEVTAPFLRWLRKEPWVQRHYHTTALDAQAFHPFSDYGVCILTKWAPEYAYIQELPTNQGRQLLSLVYPDLIVGTVHLESMSQSADMRMEQLDLFSSMPSNTKTGLFCGDFNFDATWPEAEHIPPAWNDVWSLLKPFDDGFTVDAEDHPMKAWIKPGSKKKARFDRIFHKPGASNWSPDSIKRVLEEPIPNITPITLPSDHYGLFATFSKNPDTPE